MQKVQACQATLPSPEEIEHLMQEALESTFHQLRGLYYDTALSTNNTALSALQRLVPASQILFGTDYPPAQEIGVRYAVNGLAFYPGWNEQERQEIEAQNARQLFPRWFH